MHDRSIARTGAALYRAGPRLPDPLQAKTAQSRRYNRLSPARFNGNSRTILKRQAQIGVGNGVGEFVAVLDQVVIDRLGWSGARKDSVAISGDHLNGSIQAIPDHVCQLGKTLGKIRFTEVQIISERRSPKQVVAQRIQRIGRNDLPQFPQINEVARRFSRIRARRRSTIRAQKPAGEAQDPAKAELQANRQCETREFPCRSGARRAGQYFRNRSSSDDSYPSG